MLMHYIRLTVPEISVVIPVYNEEESLPFMFERLFKVLDALGNPGESH
jgi:undecaprenyl-phosphate 4-deoxy-4-formamido-L-arabinose transferase